MPIPTQRMSQVQNLRQNSFVKNHKLEDIHVRDFTLKSTAKTTMQEKHGHAQTEPTGVLDQRAAGGDLPQLDHRVLAAGQDVLGVLGEDGGADLGTVVRLVEGGDAAVGHAVPQLDAAVLAARHVAVGRGVVAHAADGVRVLVQRVARHEALEGVDVVEAQGGVLRAHQQEVSRRVEGDGAQHFCFLVEAEGDGK